MIGDAFAEKREELRRRILSRGGGPGDAHRARLFPGIGPRKVRAVNHAEDPIARTKKR